jgi:hypothetical protein
MKSGRLRLFACWLLLALGGGGLLSPTLHFLYMAGTMAPAHACEEAPHHADHPVSPGLTASALAHPACPYAALFATVGAGTLPQSEGTGLRAMPDPSFQVASPLLPQTLPFTQHVRGPPVLA